MKDSFSKQRCRLKFTIEKFDYLLKLFSGHCSEIYETFSKCENCCLLGWKKPNPKENRKNKEIHANVNSKTTSIICCQYKCWRFFSFSVTSEVIQVKWHRPTIFHSVKVIQQSNYSSWTWQCNKRLVFPWNSLSRESSFLFRRSGLSKPEQSWKPSRAAFFYRRRRHSSAVTGDVSQLP